MKRTGAKRSRNKNANCGLFAKEESECTAKGIRVLSGVCGVSMAAAIRRPTRLAVTGKLNRLGSSLRVVSRLQDRIRAYGLFSGSNFTGREGDKEVWQRRRA